MIEEPKRCFNCRRNNGWVMHHSGQWWICPVCMPSDVLAEIRAKKQAMQRLGLEPAGCSIVRPGGGLVFGEQT